ncbi:tektin-1 [Ischnura elegans]|uniref:tektin-1 n=1 Tax=Ischnura elegans TaxID=197161 RepID=UPI001ED8883A|nr:tektin-1 [Ischnura elegans]
MSEAVPPPPPRFILQEWYLNYNKRIQNADHEQKISDRVKSEACRLAEDAEDRARANKDEVNKEIGVRIDDLKQLIQELEKSKKEIESDEADLSTFEKRLLNSLSATEIPLELAKKCLVLREGRLGIDMVRDDVELELEQEIQVIINHQASLKRALEQCKEQSRLLRSTVYFLEKDLLDKEIALGIDQRCANLCETSLGISIYTGKMPLDLGVTTEDGWNQYSLNNLKRSAKEINNAKILKSYLDLLIKQTCEDLNKKFAKTNMAFKLRIDEIKEAKKKLEDEHHKVVSEANIMTNNILHLEKELAAKEKYVALAHTRLGLRSQRPNVEHCRDAVEIALAKELSDLRIIVQDLQQKLAESHAALRYLLQTQVQLEEDINIKTNTIAIDESKCMAIRQSIHFEEY